jgi:lysylphosphatidylglycerol synthetase-like protein (DUF2156 family)
MALRDRTRAHLDAWLGFFSYKHVEYSSDLWWQFSLRRGDAPRFLRASIGVFAVLMLVAIRRLLRPAAPDQIRRRSRRSTARTRS